MLAFTMRIAAVDGAVVLVVAGAIVLAARAVVTITDTAEVDLCHMTICINAWGRRCGVGDMDAVFAGLIRKHDGHEFIELAGRKT